jgi:2'-5' RNA ligase
MRLFFAVPLPREAVDDLRAPLEEARRAAGPGFSFGNVDQLHFTLAFLGEQPETAVQAAEAAGEAARGSAFPIHIASAGAFPSLARPRVAWLGLREGAESLCALADRLRTALAVNGIAFDEKPFRPHLTVARLRHKGRVPPALLAILQSCETRMQVREVVLVRSILGRGARHQALRRFPLDG